MSVAQQKVKPVKSDTKTVKPDSKGRITLGELAEGVSSYTVEAREGGDILLRAKVEVPAREAWLLKNPVALDAVREGLQQSAKGEVKSLGSFAKYADEDISE